MTNRSLDHINEDIAQKVESLKFAILRKPTPEQVKAQLDLMALLEERHHAMREEE